MNARKKEAYIEFLRVLAAFLVIVNHTNSQVFLYKPISAAWFVSLSYFFISKTAVPIFLFITGALLLEREDDFQKSKKRILRVVTVILVFSLMYYLMPYRAKTGFSISGFIETVLFQKATNAFWYLYMYCGLMCVLPLIQKMLKGLHKKDIEYLMILSLGLAGILPVLNIFVGGILQDVGKPQINPYIGMAFAGYYMHRYSKMDLKKFLMALILFVLLIASQVVLTWKTYLHSPERYLYLDNITYFPIIASAACVYLMIRYLFDRISFSMTAISVIYRLGGLTFGIYLVADSVIEMTWPVYSKLNIWFSDIPAVLLWEIIVFSAAAVIAALLKRIPGIGKLL